MYIQAFKQSHLRHLMQIHRTSCPAACLQLQRDTACAFFESACRQLTLPHSCHGHVHCIATPPQHRMECSSVALNIHVACTCTARGHRERPQDTVDARTSVRAVSPDANSLELTMARWMQQLTASSVHREPLHRLVVADGCVALA